MSARKIKLHGGKVDPQCPRNLQDVIATERWQVRRWKRNKQKDGWALACCVTCRTTFTVSDAEVKRHIERAANGWRIPTRSGINTHCPVCDYLLDGFAGRGMGTKESELRTLSKMAAGLMRLANFIDFTQTKTKKQKEATNASKAKNNERTPHNPLERNRAIADEENHAGPRKHGGACLPNIYRDSIRGAEICGTDGSSSRARVHAGKHDAIEETVGENQAEVSVETLARP